MSAATILRRITQSDLPHVLAVSRAVLQAEVRMNVAVLASQVAVASSAGVLVLEGEKPIGYLLASPCLVHEPAGPQSLPLRHAADPDALYLHDLVIAPQARGRGFAHWLVEFAFQEAFDAGMLYAACVALPATQKFLLRFGFRPASHLLGRAARERVAGHGAGAQYMLRPFIRGTPLLG
jgi:GNAT superfamily N-acetyltransferase